MPEPSLAEVLNAVTALTGELETTNETVKEQGTYSRRNRKWIVFDIALTVAVFVGGARLYTVGNQADQNHASLVSSCTSGNKVRASLTGTLDYLVDEAAPPSKLTPVEEEQVAAIKANVARRLGPRDCKAIK